MTTQSTRNSQSLEQLYLAIQLMPEDEKADYLRALQIAPRVAALESDPSTFLQFTGFDAHAAAECLVAYWKLRCDRFGEKAFLPLAIARGGKTALSGETLEIIKMAPVAFLPKNSEGHLVVCFDTSRRLNVSEEARRQNAFFNCQTMSDPRFGTPAKGLIALVLLNEFKFDLLQTNMIAQAMKVFPARVKVFHIFNCVPRWNRNCLSQTFVNAFLSLFGSVLRGQNVFFHMTQDKDEIVETMRSHGIGQEQLPSCIGGTWSYRQLSEWYDARAHLDQERYENEYGSILTNAVAGATEADLVPHSPDSSSESFQEEEWHNQTDSALQLLPVSETTACMKALKTIPTALIQKEVKQDSFLSAEFHSPWFAARRLARYWQLREDTFGKKIFKPLNQTGEGALGRVELSFLRTGFLNLLPEDSQGCPVLWIDDSRLESLMKQSNQQARGRCLFYMFSLMAENEMAQATGCVLLYMANNAPLDQTDVAFLERLAFCLPLRIKAVHVLSSKELPLNGAPRIHFSDHVYTHIGNSEDLATKLEKFGLAKGNLPARLHGPWGYSKFIQWQEFRTRMEYQIPIRYHEMENKEAFAFPCIRPYDVLPETEKEERTRRMNVIHCRRKRDRELVTIESLQEECNGLRTTQERLIQERNRLESLLNSAKVLAERTEAEMFTRLVPPPAPPVQQAPPNDVPPAALSTDMFLHQMLNNELNQRLNVLRQVQRDQEERLLLLQNINRASLESLFSSNLLHPTPINGSIPSPGLQGNTLPSETDSFTEAAHGLLLSRQSSAATNSTSFHNYDTNRFSPNTMADDLLGGSETAVHQFLRNRQTSAVMTSTPSGLPNAANTFPLIRTDASAPGGPETAIHGLLRSRQSSVAMASTPLLPAVHLNTNSTFTSMIDDVSRGTTAPPQGMQLLRNHRAAQMMASTGSTAVAAPALLPNESAEGAAHTLESSLRLHHQFGQNAFDHSR